MIMQKKKNKNERVPIIVSRTVFDIGFLRFSVIFFREDKLICVISHLCILINTKQILGLYTK